MESPDNFVVTPWGDLWFAKDETISGDTGNRIVGTTPRGDTYVFANNQLNDSEFAGPTFSPDGTTFFVNIQNPGLTLAIWGPFEDRDARKQREMAVAAPPASLTRKTSDALAEAAERHGMSILKAAAYERLGAPIV